MEPSTSAAAAAAAATTASAPSASPVQEEEKQGLLLMDGGEDGDLTVVDLSQYSWEEKLSWLNGIDLWSLPDIPHPPSSPRPGNGWNGTGGWGRPAAVPALLNGIRLSDGPHGVRLPLSDLSLQTSFPATCFPSACAAACSWNDAAVRRMGAALAAECRYYGVGCLLGPGVNIKRHPTGGRNHEYYSEDPYLTGRMARAYIAGLQGGTGGGGDGDDSKVAACIKHYCVNNQESHRMVVNVVVDERTLRELYLPAFEMAITGHDLVGTSSSSPSSSSSPDAMQPHVHQQPKLVMSAYNRVMGEYAGENPRLLQEVLRDEWKFRGLVVSDWGAVSDRVQAVRSGLDLEMPGHAGAWHVEVEDALEGGHMSEADIDACVRRVVRFLQDHQPAGQAAGGRLASPAVPPAADGDPPDLERAQAGNDAPGPFPTPMFERHDRLARELASECIVLLQNEHDFLPLSKAKTQRVGLIGDFARAFPRYQGMGSAHVTPTKVTSVFEALTSLLGDGTVDFAPGYDANSDDADLHQPLIDEAVEIAKHQGESRDDGHPVLVFVGLPEIMESEGFDRPHLRLPRQHIALVEAVCAVNANVVVVLLNGGTVEIPDSFVKGARSIIEGFLCGQNGGGAMVDVLFGMVSPSGRLPETIPLGTGDIPAHSNFPGSLDTVEYREGLSVGYRYFNTAHAPVRFPFGHGLHYSTVEYGNLQVAVVRDTLEAKLVRVSCDVRNVGAHYSVKEVVQLYVSPQDSAVYRPVHELKEFQKVELAPGQTRQVTFELNERAFAFYDIGTHQWVVESSEAGFEVQIGASSRDIRLRETVAFQVGGEASQLARESYPPVPLTSHRASQDTEDSVFAKRFGEHEQAVLDLIDNERRLNRSEGPISVHRNTLLKNAASASWVATILLYVAFRVPSSAVKNGPFRERELRMIRANVENLPLRGLVLFSRGNITFQYLDVLILIMNGVYWQALVCLFSRTRRRNASPPPPERGDEV